jgi:hypothetical protein
MIDSLLLPNFSKTPTDETQIAGYVILLRKGDILLHVVGSSTGKLLNSREWAEAVAKAIRYTTHYDTTVLAMTIPAKFVVAEMGECGHDSYT